MFSRRSILGMGAAALATLPGRVAADSFRVPVVERLDLTVLIDSTANVFMTPIERPGFKALPPVPNPDYHRTYAAQWGYSLLARSQAGGAARTTLIDFGYTAEALLNNMAIVGAQPESLDALVLSHGHYDHFGGLEGLLETGRVKRGTPLFIGGEEAFCARLRGTTPDASPFGAIDRPGIRKAGLELIVSGDPQLVAGQGFTTGNIPLLSPERPRVPTAMLPGQNCTRAELDPAKRDRDFVVDDAAHEIATAYHLAGRGLVVIGSCSHRGIINTVRKAQAVSGVDKVHAIIGGFHLVAPQTPAQARETVALMAALDPDYVIPGHCSGEGFIQFALAAMPDKVIRSIVGGRFQFSAA
jgi:7,8-dihydropterin-6-yl-methyl-4-(beta-D-ribofuranosyl)aminobenzene 5'-phosphate synthase